MAQPLTVFPGAEVFAKLNLVAHTRQSYDIFASLGVKSINPHVADQQVSLVLAPMCQLFRICRREQGHLRHACEPVRYEHLSLIQSGCMIAMQLCIAQVSGKFDLKEPYYRQLTGSWWQPPAAQAAEGQAADLPVSM